jgi:HEXXH motif-containing protein
MLIDDAELDELVSTFIEHVSGSAAAAGDRRERYFQCLNQVQQLSLRDPLDTSGPAITVDLNGEQTRAIIKTLLLAEDMRDVDSVEAIAPDRLPDLMRCLADARMMIREYDPTAGRYLSDLVGEIILIQKSGYVSGSFWHLLGAIWISPEPTWTIVDFAETLLHESIHQSLFLADMVCGLFRCSNADLASTEMLVISPIRKVLRPYDAAFHASTVVVTLVDFYEWAGRADRAEDLCGPLLPTLTQLFERRHALTPTGEQILNQMIKVTAQSATFRSLRKTAQV